MRISDWSSDVCSSDLTQTIQKLITFPPELYVLIEKKARKLGLSFTEYMRGLAANDINKNVNILFVDKKTEEHIGKSLDKLIVKFLKL